MIAMTATIIRVRISAMKMISMNKSAANRKILRILRCKRRVLNLVRNTVLNLNTMVRTVILFPMKVRKTEI